MINSEKKNTFKATFNEHRVAERLSFITGAETINVGLDESKLGLISYHMTPAQIHEEETRAITMATMIKNHVYNKLNWRKVEYIAHCGKIGENFDDSVLELYNENSNPSDIVLVSPAKQYFGVSLKSYDSCKRLENHKQTTFTVFGETNPPTREEAGDLFEKILINYEWMDVLELITHRSDLNYYTLFAIGSSTGTEYFEKFKIENVENVTFHRASDGNFDLGIEHDGQETEGRVYFRGANTKTARTYSIDVRLKV